MGAGLFLTPTAERLAPGSFGVRDVRLEMGQADRQAPGNSWKPRQQRRPHVWTQKTCQKKWGDSRERAAARQGAAWPDRKGQEENHAQGRGRRNHTRPAAAGEGSGGGVWRPP